MKWVKPSGLKIETSDEKETIAYCKSLKWVEDKPKKDAKKESD